MSRAPFDPLASLQVLLGHGVRFIVIGGIAAAARGWPGVTQDLDVCYARDDENLERLAVALRELRARLRGAPEDVPFQLDARTLKNGDAFTFSTTAGDLDCLGTPAGTSGYADLYAGGIAEDLGGVRVRVASLDDLIRMKRASARPKDLAALETLGALREEIERGGP